MFKIALGQFAVERDWTSNAAICLDLMSRSVAAEADLLLLPEGILARDITDPDLVLRSAQPLDGPFLTQLIQATQGHKLTVIACVHLPAPGNKVWNVLVAWRGGEVVAQYRKLHLYDAFAMKESTHVVPGDEVAPLLDIAGVRVGLMTCYDLRFPELARCLAMDGADLLVLPAAWVRGPLKESHWEILLRARALENTCYLAAAGECGGRNIGQSMVVDPLGVPIVRAAETPALLFADIDPDRLKHAREQLPVLQHCRFGRPELRRVS